MRLRSTVAAVVLTAAVTVPMTGTALAADRDCKDFATQADAQAAFEAVPGDPERLDANNNGQACEEHPYAATGATAGAATTAPRAGSQVSARPAGGVAAGDGSAAGTGTDEGGPLPAVLGGLALVAAGGAAVAARRSSRRRA